MGRINWKREAALSREAALNAEKAMLAAEAERDEAREEAAAAREEGAANVADMEQYLRNAREEIERLNHCVNQLIPTEMEWRRRAIAAECVVGPLVDACKAALVPAGDTQREIEAQIRAALSVAEVLDTLRARTKLVGENS